MYASCPRRGIVPLEVPPPTPHQALVVGSYQGCSETLHVLGREVAEAKARTEWRQMGARSEHEALGIFVHDVLSRSVHLSGAPTPRLSSCATSNTETAQLLSVGSFGPLRSMYLQSRHVQRVPPLSAVISRPM